MARSLTVQAEENPSTSSLLNFFLVVIVGWMLLGAFVAPMLGVESADEVGDLEAL